MSTSLKQQLQRLAVPQTAVLADTKSKTSILFDAKEAASKDRRTIYELGYSGLQELMAINPNFQQFEATLFDESTLHMERAVEQKEVNEILDKNIAKFLYHLSPYFLLRPAHMCLEWLLRRFHAHEFNTNALMALALPYHETKTFVRVLQAVRLRSSDKDWSWLRPLQKAGVSVPKTSIINRAATYPAFLSFICQTQLEAMQQLGQRAHLLQAQINFYTSVVVGVLDHAQPVQEWHISTILRSLIKGLSSDVVDYVSSAYIISAQLVLRAELTPKLCAALLSRVASCPYERLRDTAVLLLILILDNQSIVKPQFPNGILLMLLKQKWLTQILGKLASEKVAIHALCESILRDAVKAIQNNEPEVETFKNFLDRLLVEVHFPDSTAERIISCFLDSYIAPDQALDAPNKHRDGEIIDLDSDDDDDEMSSPLNDFQAWYSAYLSKLESQYPNAFDVTIKETLKSSMQEPQADTNRSLALKMALGYRLKSFDQNATNIYGSLYHSTAKIRVFAIRKLLSQLSNFKARPQNYQLLKECLADRIADDSELVVQEVLKLSTREFIEILGCSQFVEELLKILRRSQVQPHQWSSLLPAVVKHLVTQQVVDTYDSNLILLALMPLLFPTGNAQLNTEVVSSIIKSPLADKVSFLKSLNPKGGGTGEFRQRFLDTLASSKGTPSIEELMASVQGQRGLLVHAMEFTHFLVLLTGCFKEDLGSQESVRLFDEIRGYALKFTIKCSDSSDWRQMPIRSFVPLELFSDFIVMLTQRLKKDEDAKADYACFLRILNLVTSEAFTCQEPKDKGIWSKTLKEIIEIVFNTAQDKFEFFTRFYVASSMPSVDQDEYAALRIRSFKLMNVLLKNKKNKCKFTIIHILKICVALTSESEVTRQETLETLKQLSNRLDLDETMRTFVKQIVERKCEIAMDHEQFPLILYIILKPDGKRKQTVSKKMLKDVLQFLKDNREVQHLSFTTEVLRMLKHFNNEEILAELLPLGIEALKHVDVESNMKLLKEPYSQIYQFIFDRYDAQIVENVLMDVPEAWQFMEEVFASHDVFVTIEGKLQPVPCVALESLDEYTYEKMPAQFKIKFIKLLVKTCALAENDTIFLAANKLLKKCNLDCEPMIPLIEAMNNHASCSTISTRKTSGKSDNNDYLSHITSAVWKEGVVLLELLENKKQLDSPEKIIPALFDLLKYCLQIEEQTLVEYAKQLTLSALLHCCQRSQMAGIDLPKHLPKSSFRIDQIVQCVRASPNPQTHHNALLLLSHCAAIYPQQVLHNIVDIFTFMGSSVVRQDDAFSFHIIDKIIESIIPIVIKTNNSRENQTDVDDLNSLAVPVLKIFSDIIVDVPEHRRLPLYTKLLSTLGCSQYMWAFLCVVIEAHVLEDEKQRLLQKKSAGSSVAVVPGKTSKRFDMALEIANAFEPKIVLETCIQLLAYISDLPITTEGGAKQKLKASDSTEKILFDVKTRTPKQLRHYRYLILQFMSSMTSSTEFLRKIASLTKEDQALLRSCHQNFIIRILSYVPIINSAIEESDEPIILKFWKVHLHHLHDLLDNAISLLTPDMFLVVVNGLLNHKLMSIRRKVIELLITKLQQKEESYFDSCNEENFHNLLSPLGKIISSIRQKDSEELTGVPSANTNSNELAHLQQVALIAVKLLSKMFALHYIAEFKELLAELTLIVKNHRSISKVVLATVILSMIEVSSNLKAHSLAQLPKFMPKLIEVLKDQAQQLKQQAPDNVSLAIITGMQKLFESLPLFLGPYLVDIITALAGMHAGILTQQKDSTAGDQRPLTIALHKLSSMWAKIGSEVPARNLIPNCEEAYKRLMDSESSCEIRALMELLQQSIKHNTNDSLALVQHELNNFFLNAIEFRINSRNMEPLLVNEIESTIIEAFVAYILKLSETSFRPLFHKLCERALKENEANKEAALTFFLLSNRIAEALKLLFVLFANEFIDDAAKHLDSVNANLQDIDIQEEYINIELLKAIMHTLYHIFLHDSRNFINSQRFKVLLDPLVNQLENRLVLENEDVQKVVSDCIAQLAVTMSEDVHWKELNYQVLLKTRTNVPEVRIYAFNCCVDIARKLGEEFTPLLPETVPFIAELFEDENPRVEKNTRRAVQELEAILGESLQKYL